MPNRPDTRILQFCKEIKRGDYNLTFPLRIPDWYSGQVNSFIALLRKHLPPNYCGFRREQGQRIVWVIRKQTLD